MEPLARDLPYQTSEIAAAGISETLSRFVKSPRIKEAYGWIEYKMIKYVNFSDKMVCIFWVVLTSEIKRNAFDEVLDVEHVKPLNHIWGEEFVIGLRRIQYKR